MKAKAKGHGDEEEGREAYLDNEMSSNESIMSGCEVDNVKSIVHHNC
jgi:hypothetical protein